jgi:hypothetical protein
MPNRKKWSDIRATRSKPGVIEQGDERRAGRAAKLIAKCPDCGAQTVLYKCVVCLRQDSANAMMDRITEITASLLPKIESVNKVEDRSELAILLGICLREYVDLLKWQNLTTKLKFHGLVVPREHREAFREGASAIEKLIVMLEENILECKRNRLHVVPDPKPTKAKRKRPSKK